MSQGSTGLPVTGFGFQLCEQMLCPRERTLKVGKQARTQQPNGLFMCLSSSARGISRKNCPLTFLAKSQLSKVFSTTLPLSVLRVQAKAGGELASLISLNR